MPSVPSRQDLDTQLARLDAVVGDLGTAPADRDALLWAAHEFARCARLLIETRGRPGADLDPAFAHARSAMLSLTMARRLDRGPARP